METVKSKIVVDHKLEGEREVPIIHISILDDLVLKSGDILQLVSGKLNQMNIIKPRIGHIPHYADY